VDVEQLNGYLSLFMLGLGNPQNDIFAKILSLFGDVFIVPILRDAHTNVSLLICIFLAQPTVLALVEHAMVGVTNKGFYYGY